jgi:hypothetical protein
MQKANAVSVDPERATSFSTNMIAFLRRSIRFRITYFYCMDGGSGVLLLLERVKRKLHHQTVSGLEGKLHLH